VIAALRRMGMEAFMAQQEGKRPADEITGSQTGTIGGGGFEAHNPSPVRATGSDEERGVVEDEDAIGSADDDEFEEDEEMEGEKEYDNEEPERE
jgi:hypothetical protein